VGVGGFHVGWIEDADLALEIVWHAIDSGFALLDNSWDYNDGESERRVGRALARAGYRERVLVMTKVDSHSYDGVMRQVTESLGGSASITSTSSSSTRSSVRTTRKMRSLVERCAPWSGFATKVSSGISE